MSEFENECLWDVIIDREKLCPRVGDDTTYLTEGLFKKCGRKVNQLGTMYNNKT
ncbi:MAG TPA: hypothetical protein VF540_00280 [Segetibacter sp.]